MAEADLPTISLTTTSSATLHTVNAFNKRFFSLDLQDTNLNRYRIYSRKIRIPFGGIKLLGTKPSRNRSPIHLESLTSSLLPLTAETHFGFAMVTLMLSSKRLEIGIQYFPVLSIQRSLHSLSSSHCLNSKIELLKVEKRFLW